MRATQSVQCAAERLGIRLVLLVLAVLFLALVVPQLWSLFSPFLIAIPVAAALQPLIGFFEKKLHFKRGLATALWVLVVCSAAFVLIYWFVSFAIEQGMSAARNAQAISDSITEVLRTAANRVLDAADTMPQSISASLRDSLNTAFAWLGEQVTVYGTKLLNVTVELATGVPYALIYANFLVLSIYFIAARYTRFRAYLRGRRVDNDEAGMSVLRRSAIKGVIGYLRVQLLWFVMILVLSWAFFQFTGFQYSVLIAAVAAFLEMIPQFGCGVLYIPWSLICFIIGDAQSGWMVLGLYVGYSLLRRLLDPLLLGTNLGVSPLLSLVGMFVGMRIAGVIGLILGPIAVVVLVSAVRGRVFDATIADGRTLLQYMKRRWRRDETEEPLHAGK